MSRDIFERLKAPFNPEDIEFRVGSTTKDKSKGLALAYVTSRAIMDRLDSVVGPTEWYNEVKIHEKGVVSVLTIRVGGEWVMRQDGAEFTNIESFKGGISGALKRVAVLFGIGRYLYFLPDEWVDLKFGKLTPQSIKQLRAKLAKTMPLLGDIKYPGGMSQAYADSGKQTKDEEEIEVDIPTVSIDDIPPVEPEVIAFGDDEVKAKVAANVAKATVRSTVSNVVHGVKELDSTPSVDGLMDSGISASEVTLNETPYGQASSKQQNMVNIIIERIKKKESGFKEVHFCDQYDTPKKMIEALIDYAVSIGQWTRRN